MWKINISGSDTWVALLFLRANSNSDYFFIYKPNDIALWFVVAIIFLNIRHNAASDDDLVLISNFASLGYLKREKEREGAEVDTKTFKISTLKLFIVIFDKKNESFAKKYENVSFCVINFGIWFHKFSWANWIAHDSLCLKCFQDTFSSYLQRQIFCVHSCSVFLCTLYKLRQFYCFPKLLTSWKRTHEIINLDNWLWHHKTSFFMLDLWHCGDLFDQNSGALEANGVVLSKLSELVARIKNEI